MDGGDVAEETSMSDFLLTCYVFAYMLVFLFLDYLVRAAAWIARQWRKL